MGQHLPPQPPQPMALPLWLAPRRPPPRAEPMLHTTPNRGYRCLDPSKVPRRSQPYHHATLWTPVALDHHHLRPRLIKVRPHKTVSPYPSPTTPWTPLWSLPRIVPPQFRQRLDAQIHEDYQEIVRWVRGGSASPGERVVAKPLSLSPPIPSFKE